MKISENLFVAVDYELYVANEDGSMELMEQTEEGNPLKFLFGMGMMLQKFEDNLAGLEVGDKFDFKIACADAYGEYEDENIIDLPRNIFEIDGKIDDTKVYPGAIVPLRDASGQTFNTEVVEIKDATVKVDLNHPLAGEDLYFKGTVVDVHEPNEKDLRAFSGGCGCGGNCGGGCEGGCDNGCGSCGGCQ